MGMVDVGQKVLLVEEDSSKKFCVDCNTTKTPLWRGGPAGPKSLCNACGIKFRKKRISTNRGCERKREKLHNNGSTATASSSNTMAVTTSSGSGSEDGEGDLGQCRSVRMRLMMPFWEEVAVAENVPSSVKKQRCQRWRKLGEEEQAAVSLLALSCGGSMFALGRRRYRSI